MIRFGKIFEHLSCNHHMQACRLEWQRLPVSDDVDELGHFYIYSDITLQAVRKQRSVGLISAADIQYRQMVTTDFAGPGIENQSPGAKHEVVGIGQRWGQPLTRNLGQGFHSALAV